MKQFLPNTLSALLGGAIAIWTIVLAFTLSREEFNTQLWGPLFILFIIAFAHTLFRPTKVRSIVIWLLLPSIILNGYFIVSIFLEGWGIEWGFVSAVIKVCASTVLGVIVGSLYVRKLKKNEQK